MPATAAIIGYGTTFSVETAPGSGIFTELGEITDLSPPNATTDDVDATHMKSPDRIREFIAGLTDLGDMSVGMNYIPGSGTDEFLRTWRASGLNRSCKIVYPNAIADTFPGYIKGYAPSISVADKMSTTATIKVAGAVVRG